MLLGMGILLSRGVDRMPQWAVKGDGATVKRRGWDRKCQMGEEWGVVGRGRDGGSWAVMGSGMTDFELGLCRSRICIDERTPEKVSIATVESDGIDTGGARDAVVASGKEYSDSAADARVVSGESSPAQLKLRCPLVEAALLEDARVRSSLGDTLVDHHGLGTE
jgi:hypothetical protein